MTSQSQETEHTRSSLELLYNISRELTTALDLRTVLERVVFLSMRSTAAISGSIIVLDDEEKPIESVIIIGDQIHNHTTQRLQITLERGLAGWVVQHRQATLVKNTNQDKRWMMQQYDIDEKTEPKSAVSAPLQVRERLVGVMTLVHPQAGFFTQDHLSLVQAISDQASIVVLNARLYEESQRQARVMTALAESAATITGSLNLENVLNRILTQISQAMPVQAISLALLDPQTDELVFRATTGWSQEYPHKARLKSGQSLPGWVIREGQGVVIQDTNSDQRFDPEIQTRTGIKASSIAYAPIHDQEQIIGLLEAINTRKDSFNQDDMLVLKGIGNLAGTAIRHAQLYESLQAAHQSFRELFEDSIDPIFITDWQGRIIEANRRAVLASGYNQEKLLSMTISQLHTIDTGQVDENFSNLASPDTYSYESRLRSKGGHEIPVQVYVKQVAIHEKSYLQWILRDITERKKLDTMREDLISMIYHDLRSPLSNVTSSLDILNTMLPEEQDSTLRSLLAIAQRSAERIQRLTNSLLDIQRLEAGQPVGNYQVSNPLDLINDAIQVILPVTESKNQVIEKLLPAQLPLIVVDAEMIRRVITNLLENASKYTSIESQIQIGARTEANWLYIWVQDTGPGIPASEQERIFEKFTRLNDHEKIKGLGLGLAFCRLAIEGHGGRIWVESQPAQGARFTFSLPLEAKGMK